jgi:hypothetical protein
MDNALEQELIPAALEADRYARGVGGAAARKINMIPGSVPIV